MKQINPNEKNTTLLSDLSADEKAQVGDITGSSTSIGRMAAMGISRGTKIGMIRNSKWLPLIVEVRETFLAMGRAEAEKICVKRSQR